MSSVHTIRLHAAWKRMVDCKAAGDAVGETVVSLPDVAIASEIADSVTYRRSFNRPTGLAQGDAIVLKCGLLPIASSIDFNGNRLDVPAEQSLNIGPHLQHHNELVVKIAADQFQAASLASASLEIIAAEV
jgi:hypothetical protein